MTERSKAFMDAIWQARNSGADTEEKLVAAIFRIVAENVNSYVAQNDIIVLDKNDLLQIAQELDGST